MISMPLLDTFFKAFSVERWNDKLRPIPMIQMDKHAHKMVIAWCIGKYEEDAGKKVDWIEIIEGGIFELLRRIIISDIQSPVYRELAKNKELMRKLDYMVFKDIENQFGSEKMKRRCEHYMLSEEPLSPLSQRILDAASKYASYWEFNIIKNANPEGYGIQDIEIQMGNDIEHFKDLEGIRKLKKKHSIKNFVDMCGELRYQVRWGHLPRIPKTSVLGHSLMVAIIGYMLTLELDSESRKRMYNNFFIGIFHDLPEVLTRDIIKPVKHSVPGMQEEIKRLEEKLTEQEIYPHIEKDWIPELKYYTVNEFSPKIKEGKIVKAADISTRYDDDKYNPADGSLMKVADDLAAFMEAFHSISHGVTSVELERSVSTISATYREKNISGLEVGKIFEEFLKD
ncbi:MAG: HD domain-containing protein [Candidatus Kapaibacteriales bacterium]